MPSIQKGNYNKARKRLIDEGSASAKHAHKQHDGSVPINYGKQLLREARDDFMRTAITLGNATKADMTLDHYNAIHYAADVMNIDKW